MSPGQEWSTKLGGLPAPPPHPVPATRLPPERLTMDSTSLPDATERSWRNPAVRRRSWAEASPCSKGSPTSPSTVSEQGPPWGARACLPGSLQVGNPSKAGKGSCPSA